MVDVIITYVDSNEKFRKLYAKYAKAELKENRFNSYECLDIQISLIRKHMKFVDNIYVIVQDISQIEKYGKLDAKIVLHEEIIPKFFLPCFNSCTIEMFMWKINGLKEKFIYFNDDIFPVGDLLEEDFFTFGRPNLAPEIIDIQNDCLNKNVYVCNLINSTKAVNEFYDGSFDGQYLKHQHCCRPFLRSSCERVFNDLHKQILRTLTRTRHEKNFNATLFNDYDVIIGKNFNKPIDFKYYDNELEYIRKESKIICINHCYDIDIIKKKLGGNFIVKLIDEPLDNTPCKVALCAIAKNENLYIREWVEWYKNLGISKIFLYDNNEIDGERFEEVINDHIEDGFVEVIDRRGIEKGCVYDEDGINLQPKCYIEFYEGAGKNYDWICFFDIDEFLVFKKNYTLFSFLNQEKFKNEDLILVSWEHYDDNNLLYYDSRPVMERFTHESKFERHGVKSIVRTNKKILNKHQGNLIHIFRLNNDNTIHSSGLKLTDKKTWYIIPHIIHISSPCCLNHYKTKTAQEYIKRHLNRHWGTGKKYTNHAKDINDCIRDFFRYNEETEEKQNIFKKYSFDKNYVKNELINYGIKTNNQINLDNPKSFQDKINWLKVYDSTDLKSKCADKILVHEYSKEKLGKDICIPIIKEYNNIYEFTLDWENIPNNCVIKCNHGSGYMIVCEEKSKLDKDKCISKLNSWLHINYGLDHWGYQLHYAKIKPKIFTEVLMKNDNSNKLLINYKFWCFNGTPKIVEIYQSDGPENDTREQMNFYDLDFNLLNISQWHHDNNPFRKDKKPINYDKMIDYAKILSNDFKFVRVDFYEINNQVYLGELTFTPNNGFIKFNNDKKYHTSEYLGQLLTL